MFVRFDVIHERDGQTDGRTDRQTLHDSKDRACEGSLKEIVDGAAPGPAGGGPEPAAPAPQTLLAG